MADAYLQTLADTPLSPDFGGPSEVARRATKLWLPEGKRSASTREAKAARDEIRSRQIDLEDAVEAAGGQRGALRS